MAITFELICKLVALTSFWCAGIYMNSREDGDVFYRLRVISEKWWLAKPVIHCINCMASLHSLIVLFLYNFVASQHLIRWENVGKLFVLWIIVAVICSCTNALVYLAVNMMEWYISGAMDKKNEE